MKKRLLFPVAALFVFSASLVFAQGAAPPTPADVKPGSITCEDVPYPHPVSYLPMTLYGQDIRMAYNTIGLLDPRYERPWGSIDEAYKRNLSTTYQQIHAGIFRHFSHNPSAWKPEFDKYPRIRFAWTLGADWPRYAMVQALLGQMTYLDPVVNDWAHITAPTLAFGGAEDSLAGPASVFQARMKFIADSIPNGNGKLHLIPGLGHVPHFEAPENTYPPLIAYLKEGLTSK